MLAAGSKRGRLWKALGIHVLPWLALVVVLVPGELVLDSQSSQPVGAAKLVLQVSLLFLLWGFFVPIICACLRLWPLRWPLERRSAAAHFTVLLAIVAGHGLIFTVSDAAGMFVLESAATGFSRRALAALLYEVVHALAGP